MFDLIINHKFCSDTLLDISDIHSIKIQISCLLWLGSYYY